MTDQERPATSVGSNPAKRNTASARDDLDTTPSSGATTVGVYDRPDGSMRRGASAMSTFLLLIVLAIVAYLVYRFVF